MVIARSVLPILLALTQLFSPLRISSPGAKVRAVLYYSPTCSVCHRVLSEDLPTFFPGEEDTVGVAYIPAASGEEAAGPPALMISGTKLELLLINTYTSLGSQLYEAMALAFSIPDDQRFVPLLVVGDTILVGGVDIPGQLPGIVDQGVESGGIDWPDIPGLAQVVDVLVVAQEQGGGETVPVGELSVLERIQLDPLGNYLSIVVLAGMVGSVVALAILAARRRDWRSEKRVTWWVAVLAVLGLGVSAYLTFIETSGTMAVCGPVGRCNDVQQSEFAYLFGVVPVAAVGLAGYMAILVAWALARWADAGIGKIAIACLFAMAGVGVLFSIYLTALEPFVIGATCSWCLSSSLFITLLLWLSFRPGMAALLPAAEKRGR
jgi:uncharacterized membrane protein